MKSIFCSFKCISWSFKCVSWSFKCVSWSFKCVSCSLKRHLDSLKKEEPTSKPCFFLCLCSFSSKASQFFSKASHFLPRASTNYTCEVGRLHLWAHFSLLLTGFFLRLLEECNLLCHKYIARQTTSAPEPSTRRVVRNGVYIKVQRYLLFVRYAKLFYKKVNGRRHCCCHSPKLC